MSLGQLQPGRDTPNVGLEVLCFDDMLPYRTQKGLFLGGVGG